MNYKTIYTIKAIHEYIQNSNIIAFDIETSPDIHWREEPKSALDSHKSHIVGVSLSVSGGTAIYLPFNHTIGKNVNNPKDTIEYLRKTLFENPNVIKVAHNLSFEAMFLYALGIVICEPYYDTMAAAQLTLKNDYEFRKLSDSGLKTLASNLLDTNLPTFDEVTDGQYFDELDPQDNETAHYACADSDYTLRLYHLFNGWFDKWLPRHRWIVEHIESPTAIYCGLMKHKGIGVDKKLMLSKSDECEKRLNLIRDQIAVIIGDINIGANASTSALKQYLYKDLGLPVMKTTAKFQEAADEEAFILLREWCEINRPELAELFTLLLDYRSTGKLLSTYIQGYLKHINAATGRIHPQLLPLGTESGRFSCRNPNIQNQRYGGDDGVNVRDFIIAPDGYSLIEADYSQIEVRIAAYLSRDKRLLEIYTNNHDLHAMTTSAVFQIPLDEASDKTHSDYKHRRTVAKTTFFGFMYGIYAKSLQRNLKLAAGINTTIEQSKQFLSNLACSYPTLTCWQKSTIETAKLRGYAETAFGRRRYLPQIHSDDFLKRGNAERAALNHGVQGLAADILKIAITRLLRIIPPYLKPIFTVHDSLVFECPNKYVKEAIEFIKTTMELKPPLDDFDVKLQAEISVGKSYGDMKEMED